MAATDGTSSLVEQLRGQIGRVTDAHTRRMAMAWARAWDDTAFELNEALNEIAREAGTGSVTRTMMLRSARLTNALDGIQSRLDKLFSESGIAIIDALPDVIDHTGRIQEQLIASQLPASQRHLFDAWSRVDDRQVEAIITRTQQRITAASRPLSAAATKMMKRELISGMIGGRNPKVAAARMIVRAEGRFNGGLSRAMTIARTEMLDASRAAARLAEKPHTDVLAGWIWVAQLGSRTCPACWAMNGQEFPLSEPGPYGHQNCRCVRVPKTKSWRDLGFNVEEPASTLRNAEQAFNELPRAAQVQILGRARFEAWRGGNYPMDVWAQKRTNPGWRPSYVPSQPPAGAGRNLIGRPPSQSGGGSGGGGRIPKAPSGGDSGPPIGTVLQAKGGNHYVQPGSTASPRPRWHNPDWEYEFIANATHRMTAMLQYYFETERIVKAVARNVRDGLDPLDGVTRLSAWATKKAVLKNGYTVDDLKLDAIAAGTRLAKAKEVNLGTVFRGMAIDADADDLLRRYSPGREESWSYSSATRDINYAEAHASGMPGRTKVMWFIKDAKGQILRPVGRMATIDERLINGRVQVLGSNLRADGVVEVYAKWLPK